jgi:hypothetical protein
LHRRLPPLPTPSQRRVGRRARLELPATPLLCCRTDAASCAAPSSLIAPPRRLPAQRRAERMVAEPASAFSWHARPPNRLVVKRAPLSSLTQNQKKTAAL